MTARATHWCQGCRHVIHNNEATASFKFKWNRRLTFWFHLECGLEWSNKGHPILPGAMAAAAARAGVR